MKKKFILILLLNLNNFTSIIIAQTDPSGHIDMQFDEEEECQFIEDDDLDASLAGSSYEIKPDLRPTPWWLKIAKTVGGKIFLATLGLISMCKKNWHSFKLFIGYAPQYKK